MAPAPTTPERVSPRVLAIPESWGTKTPTLGDLVQSLAETQASKLEGLTQEEATIAAEEATVRATATIAATIVAESPTVGEQKVLDDKDKQELLEKELELFQEAEKQGVEARGHTYDSYLHMHHALQVQLICVHHVAVGIKLSR